MTKLDLQQFRDSVSDELHHHLIPFWTEKVIDAQYGGFIGAMANDGTVEAKAAKGLILNARLLWTYAALAEFTSDAHCRKLAERAYDYLLTYFWDETHGGFFWEVNYQGRPLDTSKRIYGQAFAIYALSEYARCDSSHQAADRAVALFDLIHEHAFASVYGGYAEICDRDWEIVADGRLSDKDLPAKKSMNNHLHLLEAETHLLRIRSEPRIRDDLVSLLRVFSEHIIDAKTGHMGHFFDDTWSRRSDNYTFGHDIEASWLLQESVDTLNDDTLRHAFQDIILRLARVTLTEGLDPNGGLFYEGRQGQVTDVNKEWWPQAEAVVGFLNAYQVSGAEDFLTAAYQTWDFILSHMVDREQGDWFWRIDQNGQPDMAEPKVSQWKGPYHSIRACLEILHRLEAIRPSENRGDKTIETGNRL